MTTPERGLFEALISRLHAAAIVMANLPEVPGYNGSILQLDDIEAGEIAQTLDNAADELEKMEQRLAEAEAKIVDYRQTMIAAAEEINEHWQAHCDAEGYGPQNLVLRLERGIQAGYDGYSIGMFREKMDEIAQLRARCGELEEALRGLLSTSRALHSQTDEMGWRTVMTAENALQAAPQPAQQDECTRAGKHDWGSITGGMSCYKCGTSWWANTPEPKPAQETEE